MSELALDLELEQLQEQIGQELFVELLLSMTFASWVVERQESRLL